VELKELAVASANDPFGGREAVPVGADDFDYVCDSVKKVKGRLSCLG
jgi:hypothetical protein